MGTGLASGAVDQAVTNQFGDATGTITGVGTNLALDLFALKKGNLGCSYKRYDAIPSTSRKS